MIFDMHCDTLLRLHKTGESMENAGGHINTEKLRRGGAGVQCFAAFLSECGEAGPWPLFESLADIFYRETAKPDGGLRPARSAADIDGNLAVGAVSSVLTVEDGALLLGDIRRLDTLYDRGVRMLTLTWNYENCLGYPNSADPALHALGLKPFGREAVERMEELGMVVDVSHLSEGGFWNVAEQAKKPFAASHSCARALCDHSRNLTDRQLRAIGEHGGVCGVNFYSRFLRDEAEHSTLEDIVGHMAHIADRAGIEAVALGSDFDGIDCTLELGDYGGMPLLVDAMGRRFSDVEIEKICSLNARRLFGEVLGG